MPPTVEELNRLIPTCEILEFIDRGGMGAVYKAKQLSLNRIVAVKVLPPALHQDKKSFADRFRREINTLAMLNHPHIVAIHDSGEAADGLLYYVMEYVDGTTLLRRMERGGMSPRQKLAAVVEICEALQYAHDKGVIHRDIKPSNILVDSKDCVKIADFGLAKMLTTEGEASMLTATGDAVGTPDYVAPEVINGEHPVDHRADIYSLGVMLYFMLTGHTPKGVWEPPSVAGADRRLDDVVNRALKHDPGERFQNAMDITGVLNDVLRQETNKIQSQPSRARRAMPAAGPDAPTLYVGAARRREGWGKKASLAAAIAILAAGAISFFRRPVEADGKSAPSPAGASVGTPAAVPADRSDARAFAKWIFDHGGFLHATWSTQKERKPHSDLEIRTLSGLPEEDFEIWRVNFVENPAFNDGDLAELIERCRKAGTVTNIGLQGTAITPAGLSSLPKVADTLKGLDIERTNALSADSTNAILACPQLAILRLTMRYKVDLPAGAVPDEELVERIRQGLPDLNIHASNPEP
ncbi:MAG: serine/threonine protein kinase [Verrucomicrobiaceae bacterium]|nr:serine/threonine protein kinase [Verrucomicrobiaceae bacterium]